LPLPLASLPAAVSSGTVLDVEDTTQSLRVKIKVQHALLDAEEFPSRFRFDAAPAPAAAQEAPTAARPTTSATASEPAGDEREPPAKRARVEPTAASNAAADDDDECVMLD